MKIKISMDLAKYIGETRLRSVGIEWNDRGYRTEHELDLSVLTKQQIEGFRSVLDDAAKLGVRGPKILIRDIDTWLRAMTDAGKQHARTVHGFASLVTEYIRKVPGHRLYKRVDNEGIAHTCFYVNEVEYHPETRNNSGSRIPAYTEIKLLHIELGGRTQTRANFESEDIFGMSTSEALAKKGYYAETPELRAAYLKEVEKFNLISPLIGKQYYADGSGTDNLDGNDNHSHWSSYNNSRYPLNHAKVVIDVFYESEKERNSHEGYLNQNFWTWKVPKALVIDDLDESADIAEATDDRDNEITATEIEIPIHPFCACFDLRRHLRLRVHVNYLTEYIYDTEMDKKLVLPQVIKDLVTTLIAQSKTGFADIIEGKGQGVCVLLGGPPGTGKTLTAEVFSEASEKPLYSIQAAQLGIKANEIEQNLTRFLARGSRWNAIVLIDEADVYIRSRDRDMEHNAIVAAFLRILEYQTSIMFMTTNLAKQTDDAIVSRCIARIDYDCPDKIDQTLIWRILANLNNVKLTDAAIFQIVTNHPHLAGRDIKQLLKLAVLHTAKTGETITPEVIKFVSRFQPTIGIGAHED